MRLPQIPAAGAFREPLSLTGGVFVRAVADHVFDEWASTDELYTTTIKPMVTGTPPFPPRYQPRPALC